tara:strand:+ start:2192 stop:2473 length:282 start_codon:yes stop_codon:yes gene_type:complete
MITWFKKKIVSWATANENTLGSCVPASRLIYDSEDFGNGVQLSLYRANGGYVVQFSTYDHKKDERIRNLHLINSDEDMGDKLSKIITFEMLRQ